MSEEYSKEEFIKWLKSAELSDVTKELLSNMSAREFKILCTRFGIDIETNHSLEEVVKLFDVTRQQIREIEEKALKSLREREPDDDGPHIA